MKKASNVLVLVIGIIILLASYIFDRRVYLLFKDARLSFLDAFLSTITNFGVVFVVMLAIPSIILYKKNKSAVYLLWLAFLASAALAFITKSILLRQRPAETLAYPFTSIINYSFPSMHAMAVFALLPAIVEYLPRQRAFLLSFGLLAVFSRVYFGFHFLSDVVFGAMFGYFIGYFLLEMHKKKKLWK
ncbi:phosphatase PAP2 family protein [Candidatus Woesearchaeota archaeon]|nr:phosphatase PAP2 family protein [Candidatus Woesearchaeota archaeon]